MLIRNATLATMVGGHYDLIPEGAIAIRGDRILWVGLGSESPSAERVIDAGGGLVTPGLIDCHTHIVYGGNRAREFSDRLQGVTYEEIARRGGGILSTVRATRERSARELAESARPRVLNLLHEGVTTLEAKTGYGLDLATELKMVDAMDILASELPVEIAKTFLGAHALPPEFDGHPEAYVDLVCDEMIPAMAGRVEAVDVFCESIGFTLAQTQRIFESARRYGLAIKVHAEQLSYLGSAGLAADMAQSPPTTWSTSPQRTSFGWLGRAPSPSSSPARSTIYARAVARRSTFSARPACRWPWPPMPTRAPPRASRF